MLFAPDTLYADLRRDAAPLWNAYVSHRFVRELAAGTLPHAEFLAWMVQDYLYLIHYTRAYALLIYKSATVPQMRSAATITLNLLTTEISLHRAQLHAHGITENQLDHATESIETLAYSRYILDRAQTGDMLDLMVTLSPCLAGYAEIGQRLAADPQTAHARHPYRAWIDTYSGPDYIDLARDGLAQLEQVSQTHGGRARYPALLQQFSQSVRLETAFWDAGRAANVP
jgi:thiaminase/transcriptional activator TenA